MELGTNLAMSERVIPHSEEDYSVKFDGLDHISLPLNELIVRHIEKACVRNGVPDLAKSITVEYSNRMTSCAGRAYLKRNKIVLSAVLLRRTTLEDQIDTIVHEACHLICWHKHGKGGHGRHWKATMVVAGHKPNVYHCISRKGLHRRKNDHTNHDFSCGCREKFKLGAIISQRIALGHKAYRCKICKGPIKIYRPKTKGHVKRDNE